MKEDNVIPFGREILERFVLAQATNMPTYRRPSRGNKAGFAERSAAYNEACDKVINDKISDASHFNDVCEQSDMDQLHGPLGAPITDGSS